MNLFWLPKITTTHRLPEPLAEAITNRVCCSGLSEHQNVDVDRSWVPYLEGVCDGGVDARELIKAIHKHGTVTITLKGA